MASVRVRFRPGFSLGGGFPAEQFAPAWGKKTAGAPMQSALSARGGSGGHRDKMKLLLWSSTALWRSFAPERIAPEVSSDFRREGNFPESKLCGFCSGGIQQVHRVPQETIFLAPAVF
jgi:hypothetical protein